MAYLIFGMIHRYIDYKSQKMHLYLLDFCYYVNGLLCIFILFYPQDRNLFLALYSCASGGVLVIVPIFHTSLVFHSIDKTFTNSMHVSPALILLVIRIFDVSEHYLFVDSPGFFEYFGIHFIAYWTWALVYCFIIFVILGEKIKRENLMNLYEYEK